MSKKMNAGDFFRSRGRDFLPGIVVGAGAVALLSYARSVPGPHGGVWIALPGLAILAIAVILIAIPLLASPKDVPWGALVVGVVLVSLVAFVAIQAIGLIFAIF